MSFGGGTNSVIAKKYSCGGGKAKLFANLTWIWQVVCKCLEHSFQLSVDRKHVHLEKCQHLI